MEIIKNFKENVIVGKISSKFMLMNAYYINDSFYKVLETEDSIKEDCKKLKGSKDTLKAEYAQWCISIIDFENKLLVSIQEINEIKKKSTNLLDLILKKKGSIVYRLIMKRWVDRFAKRTIYNYIASIEERFEIRSKPLTTDRKDSGSI